ncbi:MAG: hypothetical protein JW862_14650 [Anaerolineales bacterium]|nr:hypothetical protein [Anaerolineales bacterium]
MTETFSKDEKTVPFYPDHVSLEAKWALGFGIFVVLVGILGLFLPVGLQAPADPMNTPAHVKPEWYFLALYQILKFIPKGIGSSIPVILVGLLMIYPFLDRKPDRSRQTTRKRMIIVAVLMVVLVALTIWGEVS